MKKPIKLVALDIDGTLIDDEYNVSKNTIETIKSLVTKGINIALVTGRANKAANKVKNQIGIDLPIISHNGGKITLANGEEISNIKLPISMAKKIIQYGEEHNIYTKIYIDDIFYVDVENEATKYFAKNHGLEYKVVKKLGEDVIEDCNMVLLIYDEAINQEERDRFKDLDLDITMSTPYALEFIPKGVSKGNGLKKLSEILGVSREEILAVGNSLNDLSMLQFAGTGIAMKNSDENLLKLWNKISEFTNNEEGVYNLLKELII